MSVMNKEELSKLILENQKEMYVLACSILKNQADAQDAVSECIVRAFENRTSLKKRTSARSWLMKILINVSRSAITKRQKVVLFADPEQYEQEPETAEDHLWSVILELPENVCVVMVLYYYEGFSVREISTLLDIPEGTTKTRLSSGRKQLAKWTERSVDMLSDEKMDRKIREHVKEHPVILPEDYQAMVQEQIKKCCEGEMHMNKKKQRKRKLIAAACVILCVGVCGAGGVRAGMNYAKQRAEQTSEKEQEALWTDAAKADADTFSRELSQKEQKRLNELAEKYQTEGLFPDGSILQISDKSEIVSDQICFLAQNSTFYLPEKALNDEQMLELIDFYAKRDYSVTAQGQKDADVTNASADDVTEISQEEALEKASTLLNQLYGIDTDTLAVETEHDQALDGNRETFTTDHITYRDEAAGISYMVSVNLQNGEIKTVSAEKDTGSNYSKEIAEDAAQYQGLSLDAEKMAHAYMGENAVWTAKQIEYMRDEKQMLGTGIVNYIFVTDADACVISYSCTQQYFYQIRQFSKDELDSYLSDEKEQGALRSLEQIIADVK